MAEVPGTSSETITETVQTSTPPPPQQVPGTLLANSGYQLALFEAIPGPLLLCVMPACLPDEATGPNVVITLSPVK